MRRFTLSHVLLACFFMLAAVPLFECAVLGIDFGSEYIKVASVKPGTPFHIVVDEQSKRKIPSVVAFDQGERWFGNGAVSLAMRKPKETYMWAHRLLGKDINSPEVAELRLAGYPWEIVELPDRRSLGFRHAAAKGEIPEVIFSVEEVVAMNLQHVIKISETDAEQPCKDAVIVVPPYWSYRERQAMLDAAEIAGINVLSLINENTAAAIQYGIDRKYEANSTTHRALFYNMGSTSTKVSLFEFTPYTKRESRSKNRTVGQFELKTSTYDGTLGGYYFEARIVDFVAKEVNKQLQAKNSKADIYKNPRAMAKIRSAAEKAKTVLSANQETQIFLSSLQDDTDFKMTINREQFYEIAADLLERVTKPVQAILEESGIDSSQLDAVIIIGGGVRIPAIQQSLKTFLKREKLDQNLNGDEAMAMGAVFRAANLSTTFQVRPFGLIDASPYPVGVRITNLDEPVEGATTEGSGFSKRASLFKRYNRLEKRKSVQFSHTQDFSCALFHDAAKYMPEGIPTPIGVYNVTGLTALVNDAKKAELLKDQKPRVSLTFKLDASALAILVKAEATLEEMVKVPAPKKPKAAPAAANATATNGTDATGDKKDETATPAADAADATAEKKAEAATPAADATAEKKEETTEEPEFIMKKKEHRIPLTITFVGAPGSLEPMNKTHKLLARATLERLRKADELKKEIAAAKNTLEAYIYSTRGQMSENDIEAVSTSEQRDAVTTALSGAEDWLYDQVDDSASKFKVKLDELKALAEPIFFRRAEATALPESVNASLQFIKYVKNQVEDYKKNRPWVKEEDLDKLAKEAEELESWLTTKGEEQAKLNPWDAPIYSSEQIAEKTKPLGKTSMQIASIKKPIEKPKPKVKVTKTNSTDTNSTTTTDAETATDAKSETKSDEKTETKSESTGAQSEQSDDDKKEREEL